MYKYKQTTDVEIGDLVVWTDISKYHGTLTKDKVYQVTNHPDQNTLNVINDKGNKNSYGKGFGFKILQTKPADQAVVGDYMYRVSSGNIRFPQYSIIKITKIDNKSNISNLYYASASSVSFNEVIVIAQAEPEITYPLFMQWKATKVIVKFDGFKSGTQLTKDTTYNAGVYRTDWFIHSNTSWKPCDFTTEPEVFDIDWWQQRFEAGLPVYVSDQYGNINKCSRVAPKNWDKNYTFSMINPSRAQKVPMSKEEIELFKQQVPLSTLHLGLCNEIPLGATADCSLPYPIIQKEKPMQFQDFINSLFTEEIKTDYEKKPNFLVTIYNSEGTEIAVATATSVKSVEDILQSSPKLWGSKAVMYSIDSEVQVSVPVITTKFKKPKEEK